MNKQKRKERNGERKKKRALETEMEMEGGWCWQGLLKNGSIVNKDLIQGGSP